MFLRVCEWEDMNMFVAAASNLYDKCLCVNVTRPKTRVAYKEGDQTADCLTRF